MDQLLQHVGTTQEPLHRDIVEVMKLMNKSSCKFWRLLYSNGMFLHRPAAEEAISAGWAMVEAGNA